MSLDQAVVDVVKNTPQCVAAGVVDVSTGMLIAIHTEGEYPSTMFDMLAAATGDMYQGENVTAIEQMFKNMRGEKGDHHYFKEFIATSDNLLHVFQRGKQNTNIVLVIVCQGSVNFGMALAKARQWLPTVEANF